MDFFNLFSSFFILQASVSAVVQIADSGRQDFFL